MKITLNKIKNANPKNKIFLRLEYMSGDADAFDYKLVEIKDIKFSEFKNKKLEVENFIKPYITISEITDVNHNKYLEKYEDVLAEYGEHIAELFNNVPGDSTCDGDMKSHLYTISIEAYDEDCEKYEGDINY